MTTVPPRIVKFNRHIEIDRTKTIGITSNDYQTEYSFKWVCVSKDRLDFVFRVGFKFDDEITYWANIQVSESKLIKDGRYHTKSYKNVRNLAKQYFEEESDSDYINDECIGEDTVWRIIQYKNHVMIQTDNRPLIIYTDTYQPISSIYTVVFEIKVETDKFIELGAASYSHNSQPFILDADDGLKNKKLFEIRIPFSHDRYETGPGLTYQSDDDSENDDDDDKKTERHFCDPFSVKAISKNQYMGKPMSLDLINKLVSNYLEQRVEVTEGEKCALFGTKNDGLDSIKVAGKILQLPYLTTERDLISNIFNQKCDSMINESSFFKYMPFTEICRMRGLGYKSHTNNYGVLLPQDISNIVYTKCMPFDKGHGAMGIVTGNIVPDYIYRVYVHVKNFCDNAMFQVSFPTVFSFKYNWRNVHCATIPIIFRNGRVFVGLSEEPNAFLNKSGFDLNWHQKKITNPLHTNQNIEITIEICNFIVLIYVDGIIVYGQ